MTTWTLEQIRHARSLRASIVVDDELVHRHGQAVLAEAEAEMARRLGQMAQPFGIDLDTTHRHHYEITWERSDANPWQVTGHMRWNPATHTAELRGGRLDGQRYEVRDIGEPFRAPRLTTTPFFDADETHDTAAMTEIGDTYELVGWRETEHVWVYATRA